MHTLPLQTAHLTLVLQTTEEVLAGIAAMPAADQAQVSPAWLARLKASAPHPWTHGFALREQTSGTLVGRCGFKTPPAEDGSIEIAYGIDPKHQGKGYATEAATALTAYAFDSGAVRVVFAHTLPVAPASQRVLAKCGFQFVGEVIDPEDGLVWRWEKRQFKTAAASPSPS